MPCYLKNHSQGEYVFDYGWADAFERAGGRYYPKLQSSVPFTPATGPRLMAPAGERRAIVQSALSEGLKTLAGRHGVSSAHVTFVPDDEIGIFEAHGYLHRTDQQFHFMNEGYGSYDDFLDTLASRKRKNLRKERRAALEHGITIDWLTGRDLTEGVWDTFFRFYMDTGSRKWGRPYLTRRFFSLVGERMADDILLVMAKRDGRYVAGAINFIGGDCLYGRHWGCIEEHPFLHFEVCYHQAMDYVIAHKLDPRRGRSAGTAQAGPRLRAGHHPLRPFHHAWRPAPGDRGLSRTGARRGRACRRGARRTCALPEGLTRRSPRGRRRGSHPFVPSVIGVFLELSSISPSRSAARSSPLPPSSRPMASPGCFRHW